MSLLRRHEKTHTVMKPYVCQQCGKTFTRSAYLQIHRRSHADGAQLSYVCKQCGKLFIHRRYLQLHERVHVKKKPYGCKHCGKAFSYLTNVQRHEQICYSQS
jgi:KRAB domain-containing zinc finger protein